MISREDAGSVAVLRLAHGKVSALDIDLCEALVAEIEAVRASAAAALVLTGTGSSFSAGVDLFKVLQGGAPYVSRFLPALDALLRTLLLFPRPAVAAINGHAIAGGCILAAACDHRVMAAGTARVGVPELAVGVPFPALPFATMSARVAPAAFRELVLSGRTVPPPEALALGLVDEVVDASTLSARAREAAQRLAAIPALTFAITKRAFAEPILARAAAAADLNVAATAAWADETVLARIRDYLAQTIGKK